MEEEYRIKSTLLRTIFAVSAGLVMIILKFLLKEEDFVQEVYNYLATDIVFLK